ncbi:MAG: DNA primase catalytic subunit PriS [Euryarchaeota archaeon]|nr:DNA primase catalytic subunit PriS [Euryarchaeota archaeon]|tara:strand:+ start:139 stop:1350 length:1212 start_codon:yes stop_codon:yes gene_type:complete
MAGGWSRFALRFSEYYASLGTTTLWTPPRLRSREWMFVPWGGGPPDRHRAFQGKTELLSYLQNRTPHSCFHSTAYYQRPSNRKMSEKGWLGADLIFDLDGDHLPGVSDTDFPTMIDTIQHQAWRLWSEFLKPELGFRDEYVQTTFSGHRGFHIHVRDPNLLHLDSNARREIVNYIRGEGIDVQSALAGPDISWGNRARSGMDSVLEQLRVISDKGADRKATLERLHGILKSRAKSPRTRVRSTSKARILELAELAESTKRIDRLRGDRALSVFGEYCTPIFWELVKGDASVVMGSAGETDEAVTVDTKRVIRWVGSLHGKSGLRVTEFPLHRLDPSTSDRFEPTREAVVFSLQNSMAVTLLIDDVTAELAEERIEGNEGEIFEVSEAMATFLTLKGWAEVVQQ